MIDRSEMNELRERVEDLLDEQIRDWELVRTNTYALANLKTRNLWIRDFPVILQFNPERIRSSAAKTDAASLQARPCFFCHRPEEQYGIDYNDAFDILVNPYPISGGHLTIPLKWHEDQQILPYYEDMLWLAHDLQDYAVFYNGPKCGASAPDHMHFQAMERGNLPIEVNYKKAPKGIVWEGRNTVLYVLYDFMASAFLLISSDLREADYAFKQLYAQLEIKEGDSEPMMNVVTWKDEDAWKDEDNWISCIFPRKELRPSCFYAEGDANILISPATVEMAGLFITPLEKDFDKVTSEDLETILREVSISEEEKNEIVRKMIQSSSRK